MDSDELWRIAEDLHCHKTASVAWKAKAKELRVALEDVENEWDAERIRYQEQLKRVAELEEALREIEKVGDDAIAYEWWELPMKVSQIIERALNK